MVKLYELFNIDESKETKRIDAFVDLAKSNGAGNVRVEYGKGYPQLRFEVQMEGGCYCSFIMAMSKTPSDHRSDLNFISDIKKSIRLAKLGQCELAKGRIRCDTKV